MIASCSFMARIMIKTQLISDNALSTLLTKSELPGALHFYLISAVNPHESPAVTLA